MLRNTKRSTSRNSTSPVPGPRLIETPANITTATDGDDIMGISPEVPPIQPSSLRGLRFPSLQETSPFQMPTDQQHWFSMQTKIETDAPKLTNAILSMYKGLGMIRRIKCFRYHCLKSFFVYPNESLEYLLIPF